MRPMSTPLALAPLALLVALAAACGSDGPDRTTDDAGTTDAGDVGGDTSNPDAGADADATDDADTTTDTDATSDGGGADAADAEGGDTTDSGTDANDGGDAGDAGSVEPPDRFAPTVETCGTLPPPTSGALCDVEAGASGAIVVRGTVLTPGTTFVGGEVVVSASGTITCVGCDCSDDASATDASIVTCADGVVSPGLINGHDHITFNHNDPDDWGDERFEHRHDWRTGARGNDPLPRPRRGDDAQTAWGEVRHLLTGTTSIAGAGQADGIVRNLDRAGGLEGLGIGEVQNNTFPLGDAGGTQRSRDCSYPSIDGDQALSYTCYLPHVAEGIDDEARNEFLCLSSDERGGRDLMEPNTAIIHGVGLLAEDVVEMARNGSSVIWSPRTNIALYGNTAPVTLYDTQGVVIGLGTDWTASGSAHMLRELTCASAFNDTWLGGWFTDYDLWMMATTSNAEALKIDHAVGTLAPGLVGDIAVFDGTLDPSPYRAIFAGNAHTVGLVLRGGEAMYGDAATLAALRPADDGCEALPSDLTCDVDKILCIEADHGQSFASLAAANRGSYGVAFCGVPDGEPECLPLRPDEYGGSLDGDRDGDGVPDTADNCPDVFNPVRPVDGDDQANADGDRWGDVCDPCPLNVGLEGCEVVDRTDRDGDGVRNDLDNCPNDANEDQADRDTDDIGDVCDPCPDAPNPGGAACPATIYDIKQGLLDENTEVRVEGVVTAIDEASFFLQTPVDLHDESLGYRYSGAYVFIPRSNPDDMPIPSVGDRVALDAQVGNFRGQWQLSFVSAIDTIASDVALPAPQLVAIDELDDADVADSWEGVLITVDDGEVTALNPPAEGGDEDPTLEYVLDDILRVNDRLYLTYPFPGLGDVLDVTGVLRWADDNYKLEPRFEDDVVFVRTAPPEVVSVGPDAWLPDTATEAPSVPSAMRVELSRPVTGDPITVTVASSDDEIATVADVEIPVGETGAELVFTALDVDALADVTITATFGESSADGRLTVFDDDAPRELEDFTAEALTVPAGGDMVLTLVLNLPADDATEVAIETEGVAIDAPTLVEVPEGQFEASFTVTADEEIGEVTLTASISGTEAEVILDVVDEGPLRAPEVAGDLLLSEIMPRSQSGSDNGEWFELHNPTRSPLELEGCEIYDNRAEPIDASLIIEPGGYAVFARSSDPAVNHGLPRVDWAYGGIAMSNSGEVIGIRCGGTIIDQFDYPSSLVVLGAAAQLRPDVLDPVAADAADAWCIAPAGVGFGTADKLGTPGAATVCEAP